MKKYVLFALATLLTVGAAVAQTGRNGYYNQSPRNQGNNGYADARYNTPRGNAYGQGNRGGNHGYNHGPRGNAYGHNAYSTGTMSACGTVLPAGCFNTRVVYQTCSSPGWRWQVTEGYYWVPGYYVVDNCGRSTWIEGHYEWRVHNRQQVRYGGRW